MMRNGKRWVRQLGCMVLCVALFITNVSAASSFRDVDSGADYAEAVEQLAEMGILTGDERGYFNPNSAITRAEAATIICRLMGVEDEAKSMKMVVFDDVSASHWAVGYVAMAADMGIINGNGDGSFAPEDPVTYQQMAKMLVCAWGYEESAIEQGGWPDGYMQVAEDLGIVDFAIAVEDIPAPRRDVAKMAYNVLFTYENTDYYEEEK